MNAELREFVRVRARHRCEYCHLPQSAAPFLAFHVEHVLAQQHIADDRPENLAFACPDCNRHKGPNLTTLDPETREIVRLFNPREDEWTSHFAFNGPIIFGLTPIGTATARLLQMNAEDRIEMRAELMEENPLQFD
jgi:hypothetical protein